MDDTRTLHQFVVLNLVELVRSDHMVCLQHMQTSNTIARIVEALETR
jgi:hypothetical protein